MLVLLLGLLPCGAVAWLFLFLGVFGCCCSSVLYVIWVDVLFFLVDGCVASVVFIRCIPDLGVGVSSSIVLFSVVPFLIMLLSIVLFCCCFYLIKIASLIFSFSSFWFFFSF